MRRQTANLDLIFDWWEDGTWVSDQMNDLKLENDKKRFHCHHYLSVSNYQSLIIARAFEKPTWDRPWHQIVGAILSNGSLSVCDGLFKWWYWICTWLHPCSGMVKSTTFIPKSVMIMTSDKTSWLNLCLYWTISWALQLKKILRIEVLIWMTNMILMRMMMSMLWWWGKSDGGYLMVFARVNFAAGQRAGLRWNVRSSMFSRKVYVANEKVNVVTNKGQWW